jgi:hypothetical protein
MIDINILESMALSALGGGDISFGGNLADPYLQKSIRTSTLALKGYKRSPLVCEDKKNHTEARSSVKKM